MVAQRPIGPTEPREIVPAEDVPLSDRLTMAAQTLAAMMEAGEFMLVGHGTLESLRGLGSFLDGAAKGAARLERRIQAAEGFQPINEIVRRIVPPGVL